MLQKTEEMLISWENNFKSEGYPLEHSHINHYQHALCYSTVANDGAGDDGDDVDD